MITPANFKTLARRYGIKPNVRLVEMAIDHGQMEHVIEFEQMLERQQLEQLEIKDHHNAEGCRNGGVEN